MFKRYLILSGIVLLKFVLQCFLISPEYDLQRDEYLHLDQANHLAWGYLSVPPFTSWISVLIKWLGNSVFWVKFFPALFGAMTIVVVWKTIETLKGNLFACVLGAISVLLSALLRINTLYQPNSLDILCWTAFYYFVIKYFNSENAKWIYAASITFAIAFLNKYNIIFLAAGFLPALLLSAQRTIFFNKQFWIAAGIAFIIASPNLIWQIQNHFPVVHHMKELAGTQLIHVKRVDFLQSQLMFFMGSLALVALAFYALAVYRPFHRYKFFLPAYIFTIIIFLFLRAKAYYAIGLYPVYIAFGAAYLSVLIKNKWRKILYPIFLIIPIVLFIPMFRIAFPNRSPQFIIEHPKPYQQFGLLKWEDGKNHLLPQDFADMLGWKQLASKTDSVFNTLPVTENTFILCDNYGQAGAINFYKTIPALTASSFHADYVNWVNFSKPINNLILITRRQNQNTTLNKWNSCFDSVYLAAQRINTLAREDTILIYTLKHPKTDINELLALEAQKTILSFR